VILVCVTWMVVVVVTDMEVEVEEACAELSVPVPVAGGMQAETADNDDEHETEGRAHQARTADQGSAKALHFDSRSILPAPQPARLIFVSRSWILDPLAHPGC
jgi:hypothetical protein